MIFHLDVDECALNHHNCHQKCINTEGSFKCECHDGYQFVNGTKCEDINECRLPISECSFYCENVPGSYKCTCPPGLKLDKDNKSCIGK